MNKLLIICGPTATGKTNLALQLAQQLNGELISADSRQLYQHMDIGTGKNLPDNATKHTSLLSFDSQPLTYYQVNHTKIWGYDLVTPNQEFSLAHYQNFSIQIIEHIYSQQKLPILVGGTGLYLKAATEPLNLTSIPRNSKLRQQLESLTLIELQQQLNKLSKKRFAALNNSDLNNPRRLIRVIETETHLQQRPHKPQLTNLSADQLWIGLTAPKPHLTRLVEQNINSRATDSFTQEINHLNQLNFKWDSNPATATGYAPWRQYLSGDLSKEQAIKLWITSETQYQKRQLTWFNKQKQINWFDITYPDCLSQVEHRVETWYSKPTS